MVRESKITLLQQDRARIRFPSRAGNSSADKLAIYIFDLETLTIGGTVEMAGTVHQIHDAPDL